MFRVHRSTLGFWLELLLAYPNHNNNPPTNCNLTISSNSNLMDNQAKLPKMLREQIAIYRPLSRRLVRCDRVIQDESGDSNGGNV